MTVESWDPTAAGLSAKHRQILTQAVTSLEGGALCLTDDEQATLRPAMRSDGDAWTRFVATESDDTIEAWIKVLTLVERDLNGFEVGNDSPVLPLIKVLKQRDSLPNDLFAWIKSNTSNRFLPYGSLADRL